MLSITKILTKSMMVRRRKLRTKRTIYCQKRIFLLPKPLLKLWSAKLLSSMMKIMMKNLIRNKTLWTMKLKSITSLYLVMCFLFGLDNLSCCTLWTYNLRYRFTCVLVLIKVLESWFLLSGASIFFAALLKYNLEASLLPILHESILSFYLIFVHLIYSQLIDLSFLL